MDTNPLLQKAQAGSIIKRYRQAKRLGILRFSRLVDLSPAGVASLENGAYGASPSNLRRIVEALDIDPSDVAVLIDAYSARLREAVCEWDDLRTEFGLS